MVGELGVESETQLFLQAWVLDRYDALDPALEGGAADRAVLSRCVTALRRATDAALLNEAPREATIR